MVELAPPALRKENDELNSLLNDVLGWARDHDDNFTLVGPAAPPIAADFAMEVQVQDANNILERFSLVGQVTVTIGAGTATNEQLISNKGVVGAVGASLLVPIVGGVGKFSCRSSAADTETFIMGLTDSGATGLTATDTHTATYTA